MPTDLPTRPNPWCDLLVPMSQATTFLTEVQAAIAPTMPGDRFQLLLIPMRSSRFTRPLFRTADEELMLGFDPLRSLLFGSDVEPVLAFNRGLYDRCKELGGSQYPISAFRLGTADSAVHYGEQWSRLLDAKCRFDPANTLASGPDVLGSTALVLRVAPAACVAVDGQRDEAVDQLGVRHAGGLPQLRVHRDRREAGHRVGLVAEEAAAVLLEEEVDPGETVAAQHLEHPHGERAHLVALRADSGAGTSSWAPSVTYLSS